MPLSIAPYWLCPRGIVTRGQPQKVFKVKDTALFIEKSIIEGITGKGGPLDMATAIAKEYVDDCRRDGWVGASKIIKKAVNNFDKRTGKPRKVRGSDELEGEDKRLIAIWMQDKERIRREAEMVSMTIESMKNELRALRLEQFKMSVKRLSEKLVVTQKAINDHLAATGQSDSNGH